MDSGIRIGGQEGKQAERLSRLSFYFENAVFVKMPLIGYSKADFQQPFFIPRLHLNS